MNTLGRYLTREVLRPFLVICLILAGLFSSFNAARYLAEAVTESLGMVIVARLILLKTVIALEVLVPVSLYAAVIVALGRLHRDQEIVVLRSAGIGENYLIRQVFMITLPVAILTGLLSIYGRPWAYEQVYRLDESARAELDIERYQAGRFYGNEGSGRIIYIQDRSNESGQLQKVFHYQRSDDSSDIILAREGYQQRAGEFDPPQLHLQDGVMYRMEHASTRDSIIRFSRFVYMPDPTIARDYQRKAASTVELSFSSEPRDIAEFQWRVSRALSAILLAMIAIPLSRASPRQGKGEKIISAAVIFAIYYNLSSLAQTWVEQGYTGHFPGVWWLHMLMLAVVVTVLAPRIQKRTASHADT